MRTKVKLIITDDGNVTQSAFVIDFENQLALDCFVETSVNSSLKLGATVTPEMTAYDFKINGVKVQRGSKLSIVPPESANGQQT